MTPIPVTRCEIQLNAESLDRITDRMLGLENTILSAGVREDLREQLGDILSYRINELTNEWLDNLAEELE